MTSRSYEGPSIDVGWQYFHERPAATNLDEEAEDVVYATAPEDSGEERAENVPIPKRQERPDVDGQSTIGDWSRWSR